MEIGKRVNFQHQHSDVASVDSVQQRWPHRSHARGYHCTRLCRMSAVNGQSWSSCTCSTTRLDAAHRSARLIKGFSSLTGHLDRLSSWHPWQLRIPSRSREACCSSWCSRQLLSAYAASVHAMNEKSNVPPMRCFRLLLARWLRSIIAHALLEVHAWVICIAHAVNRLHSMNNNY
jgi:hypothetical protein